MKQARPTTPFGRRTTSSSGIALAALLAASPDVDAGDRDQLTGGAGLAWTF